MLVVRRLAGSKIEHRSFEDILSYLQKGDVIILNNSKIIPTRLWGALGTGEQREVTLVQRVKENIWTAYIRPDMGLRSNLFLYFNNEKVKAVIVSKNSNKMWRLAFFTNKNGFNRFLYTKAEINLPFYLRFPLKDRRRYQPVYAQYPGSCQPPTAGLHFTRSFLKKIQKKGVKINYITLHISGSILSMAYTNSKPVRIEKEWCVIYKKTAQEIIQAKEQKKKVIAVGTTVMRALESVVAEKGEIAPCSGWADLTILPGFKFKIVDAFLTNFHLPGSSHLLLTCAFGGKKRVLGAYKKAIVNNYRFLDFGDSMLIV